MLGQQKIRRTINKIEFCVSRVSTFHGTPQIEICTQTVNVFTLTPDHQLSANQTALATTSHKYMQGDHIHKGALTQPLGNHVPG